MEENKKRKEEWYGRRRKHLNALVRKRVSSRHVGRELGNEGGRKLMKDGGNTVK